MIAFGRIVIGWLAGSLHPHGRVALLSVVVGGTGWAVHGFSRATNS
jgi:hypothetical protein